MSIIPLIVYLVAAFVSPRPDFDQPRPGVDIQHYSFDLTLSDHSNVIEGKAKVTVRFTEGPRPFYLDLVGRNSFGSGMKVNKIFVSNVPIPFEHTNDKLWLNADLSSTDSVVTYEIHYLGVPADGLIISKNRYGDRTFFADNWPNRARQWLPTVDHPADKALVDFIVRTPDHYQVVSNGQLIEETDAAPGTRTTHWRATTALPTKIMVIGVARFAVQNLGRVDGVDLQTWVFPQDREEGFYDFALAVPILKYFVQSLGSFPYKKLANVQSTTRYGGMENAGAIFYHENVVTGRRALESTVAHEIAHQWFGDSASERDWHHVWLSEGFATYLAHLYLGHRHGSKILTRGMATDRQRIINYATSNPTSSVVDTTIVDPNDVLNVNSYEKGGWTLHMLRAQLGDDTFWEVLNQYYDQYDSSNATTQDFQRVAESVSGSDLGWFFDQWIFRPGVPEVSVGWSFDEMTGEVVIEAEQTQAEPYRLSLEVEIALEDDRVMAELELTKPQQTFRVAVQDTPQRVTLDPNVRLLARINGD